MALATLTQSGRAAIARAIAAQPLFLAWGSGDPAWDADDATLPSLVTATRLVNELGRRRASSVGYVTPDEDGGIVIPVSTGGEEAQEMRYRVSPEPTPYLYCVTNFDFNDAPADGHIPPLAAGRPSKSPPAPCARPNEKLSQSAPSRLRHGGACEHLCRAVASPKASKRRIPASPAAGR